jgi:hypothetical protein
MYSGSTLQQLRTLDTWFGAHQKIDRLAWHQLVEYAGADAIRAFPLVKNILLFEGPDGPDAIKRKTPAQDEPWHYYNPSDPTDVKLPDIIAAHHGLLVKALREGNQTRASFEAAWLAHAIVDGLTPAHHYPYEEELQKLRNGAGIESRTTPKEKLVMHGDTVREKFRNNWRMWGDKGLLATHIAFEAGVALLILPIRYNRLPKPKDMNELSEQGTYVDFFKSQATHIASLELYTEYYASGWTPKLAKKIRRQLIPEIVVAVAFAWYEAIKQAQTAERTS